MGTKRKVRTKVSAEFVRSIHDDNGASRTPSMTRFRAFVLLAYEAGTVEALRDKCLRKCERPDRKAMREQFDAFLQGKGDIAPDFARHIEAATGKPSGWMDQPHRELVPRDDRRVTVKEPESSIIVTPNVKHVLRGLLENKDVWIALPQLQVQMLDVPSGSVYQVVQRLVGVNWIARDRERGGYHRYIYKLTELGIEMARRHCEPSPQPEAITQRDAARA